MRQYNRTEFTTQKNGNLSNILQLQIYTESHLEDIPQIRQLPEEQRRAMHAVAKILPFRVNRYVIEELIDWNNIPDDPIFQLTFPQQGMLAPDDFDRVTSLIDKKADAAQIHALANEIRQQLNPHPAGQRMLNMPQLEEKRLEGMQHKYRETVLFFPSQGQTCHSYCSFCFRWAQFIGDKELRISAHEATYLHRYLKQHREITDLLITGGDPMVMKTRHLANYLEPLLAPEFEHVQTFRIGTKSLSFWPHRFVFDADADDLLRLLAKLVKKGKHVAIMAHYNHWRELETPIAREAIGRLRDTGAIIRSQSPLVAHINDNAATWARMWKTQVRLGIVPYYMFVERDTGARRYFEVPLAQAWKIYREAIQQVSGIARTARGPSMSATPGKVEIQGVADVGDEKVFVLRFIQGRNPDWIQRPFFARYNEHATWLDDLQPALGAQSFFFQSEYDAMLDSVTPHHTPLTHIN